MKFNLPWAISCTTSWPKIAFIISRSEFQAPPIGHEYELQRDELFTVDLFGHKYSWNDAKEDEGKKIILVHVDIASHLLVSRQQL